MTNKILVTYASMASSTAGVAEAFNTQSGAGTRPLCGAYKFQNIIDRSHISEDYYQYDGL